MSTADPLDDDSEIGGVHVKYLLHCPRQLWLYSRGYRPEAGSDTVAFGEAVDDTAFSRQREIDLGAAKIDWVTAGAIVHETKSSRAPSEQHEAQVRHYCLLLERRGVNVRGGRLHYPVIRRTVDVPWDQAAREAAVARDWEARQVIALTAAPSRLPRARCRGCSFTDYCWGA